MPAAEPSIKELFAKGKEAESNADINSAISFYKAIIVRDNLDTDAYNKLMNCIEKQKHSGMNWQLSIKLLKHMRHITKSIRQNIVK